jgi:1-acyl-sn-glycerol-3-phosphate acyltransferase
MLFFPEGTRSPDGEIKDFKLGAFKLARDTQAPIVPIALHGANNLLPKHGRMPQSAHVRLRVLPMEAPPPPQGDLDSYAAGVRAKIVAAHAGLL